MDKPYLKITLDDIIADAKENKRVKFLKNLRTRIENKETGEISYYEPTFLEVKRLYCEEYPYNAKNSVLSRVFFMRGIFSYFPILNYKILDFSIRGYVWD